MAAEFNRIREIQWHAEFNRLKAVEWQLNLAGSGELNGS